MNNITVLNSISLIKLTEKVNNIGKRQRLNGCGRNLSLSLSLNAYIISPNSGDREKLKVS